ncbi:expressed unknown protein [Seminavis robusta]|uniref:Cytochrome P450 n=1 Tax=Seminavis robusta TaxID=568900 RepID=A0A9N8DUT0_9STRA|nr:expressed unknown protein [Seminavis robusta]|eukprot:Sro373_g129060.1 n/a (593) ;mRNA; f:49308-51086
MCQQHEKRMSGKTIVATCPFGHGKTAGVCPAGYGRAPVKRISFTLNLTPDDPSIQQLEKRSWEGEDGNSLLRFGPQPHHVLSPTSWVCQGVRLVSCIVSPPVKDVLEVSFRDDQNLYDTVQRFLAHGPEEFFAKVAQPDLGGGLVQVCLAGFKWVYVVTNSDVADQVVASRDWDRGDSVYAFGRMVGSLFGTQSGKVARKGKRTFLAAVGCKGENLKVISNTVDRAFADLYDASWTLGGVARMERNLYKFCNDTAVGSVCRILLGSEEGNFQPDNALQVTMRAAENIVIGGTDLKSVVFGPEIRSEFCEARDDLHGLFHQIIVDYAPEIAKGKSYAKEWAVDQLRAQGLEESDITEQEIAQELAENRSGVASGLGALAAFASFNVTRSLYFLLRVLEEQPTLRASLVAQAQTVPMDEPPTYATWSSVPLVTATVEAVLAQLLPTCGMPREAMVSTKLKVDGKTVTLPKGSLLVLNFASYQKGRHNNHEQAMDPAELDVTEWMGKNTPKQWAFGRGDRACPAQHVARDVLRVVLLRLCQSDVSVDISRKVPFTHGWGGHGPLEDNLKNDPVKLVLTKQQPADDEEIFYDCQSA